MIEPHWRRIAGIHGVPSGTLALVWMALDPDTDTIHVYDACFIKREVLPVVVEALNARGRWIPVAWPKSMKETADELLEKGVNMTHEYASDSEEATENQALEVWTRMRSGRMKVAKRLGEWLHEFNSFRRDDSKVPVDTFPMMSATRHAVALLSYAQRQAPRNHQSNRNYPKVAIV